MTPSPLEDARERLTDAHRRRFNDGNVYANVLDEDLRLILSALAEKEGKSGSYAADLPCAPNAHPESDWVLVPRDLTGAMLAALKEAAAKQSTRKDPDSVGALAWDFCQLWRPVVAAAVRSEATITDASKATGAEGDRRDVIDPIESGGLTELRALSEKATAGEWVSDQAQRPEPDGNPCWIRAGGSEVAVVWGSSATGDIGLKMLPRDANAAFIVAAVNYVRQALSSTPPAPNGEVEDEPEPCWKCGGPGGDGPPHNAEHCDVCDADWWFL